MNKNRPTSRKVTHSGGGTGVHKTGAGRGGGPAGSGGFFGGGSGASGHGGSGHSNHSSGGHGGSGSSSHSSHGSGGSNHSSHGASSHSSGYSSGGGRPVVRSKGGILTIIVMILAVVFGGGGLAMNGLGGGDDYQNILSSGNGSYNGWFSSDAGTGNTGVLNTNVSEEARAKYTKIKGGGADTNTIMVYMCGTDLESRSGMATSDLNEMISATVGRNVNLIVYTGGCSKWRNNTVSSRHNQIWQIRGGNIKCLVENAGSDSMTKAATLTSFIRWAAKNFPANRMDLIFWDHGGGSISGYGYDEKFPRTGSMTLGNINKALKDAGIKYDFIGFDACLMATAETALMLDQYADYLIGSEETEPGIGWYYTNWLTNLSADPSMETLQIGKQIADDFTKTCAKKCPGQSTTLSLTDLSELSQTMPDKLNAFAEDAADKISGGQYQQVATARGSSKEFARSNGIDQIDLAHFASLMDTTQGRELTKTLVEAVKYNRTSGNTANAYGLSIYFPYKKLGKVDSMTNTYQQIGMDDDYTACIRQFAQMQTCGQAVSGGSTNPFEMLGLTGSTGSYGSTGGQTLTGQAMQTLVSQLLSGSFKDFKSLGIDGLNASNTGYLSEDALDPAQVTDYISDNNITSEDLAWQKNGNGEACIQLSEEQWDLIESADKTILYDDGDGYIEMGLDNAYDFDDDGNLLPEKTKTWISIDGQPVAYYHTETLDFEDGSYSISGYAPVVYNGKDAHLILTFDSAHEDGYIAGVQFDYDEDVTQTSAKSLTSLAEGDQIKFLGDFYSYKGHFKDKYQLGRTWTVDDPEHVTITNTDLGSGDSTILYKFTDIYGQEYWTPALQD